MIQALLPPTDDAAAMSGVALPTWVSRAGPEAERRFVEFFAATIRNRGTRAAYLQAVLRFARWCEGRGVELHQLAPLVVAAHIEQLQQ